MWKPVWRQIVRDRLNHFYQWRQHATDVIFKRKASDSITLRHKKSELYVNVWWIIKLPPIFWQPPTYYVYIYLSANSPRWMCRDGRQFVITTLNSSCANFSSNENKQNNIIDIHHPLCCYCCCRLRSPSPSPVFRLPLWDSTIKNVPTTKKNCV